LQRLRRNDRSMIRWICGVKPHDEISIDLLCARLGIQEVTAALCSKRLRWYGHVVRSSSCIKSVTNMEVPCSKAWGRPRPTWSDCVKADMNACSIGGIDPQNRTAWRSCIRSIGRLLTTPATGTNRSSWKIKSGSSQVKSNNSLLSILKSVPCLSFNGDWLYMLISHQTRTRLQQMTCEEPCTCGCSGNEMSYSMFGANNGVNTEIQSSR